jgi:ribosomal protein S18 acetylase RimI-like enzyme
LTPNTLAKLTVRSARPSDRQFVLDLADRLVDFDVPAWRPKPELVEGDRRALAGFFEAPKPDESLYVAEIDGVPAGCAYLVTLVDYFNQRPHAHLSVLAVAKDAEGKGVGSVLLDQCVVWAKERNSDRLTLSALVTNSRARALYERKGFGGEYIRYVLPL